MEKIDELEKRFKTLKPWRSSVKQMKYWIVGKGKKQRLIPVFVVHNFKADCKKSHYNLVGNSEAQRIHNNLRLNFQSINSRWPFFFFFFSINPDRSSQYLQK